MIAIHHLRGSVENRTSNHYLKWFQAVFWLGILDNLSFAVPAVFAPAWLLQLVNLPMSDQPLWLRDSGMLLLFLSAMYVPAALDPVRYSFNVMVAMVARLVFAVFWLAPVVFGNAPAAYLLFGLLDLGFGLVQVILFILFRYEDCLT